MAKAALNIDFRIGSNGTPTVLVDLSTKVASIDFPREQDVLDATGFNGNNSRAYVVGLNGATFEVEFFWDLTVDGHLNALIGYETALDFRYGPDGTATSNPRYTGKVFIESLSQPVNVGDVKKFSATFSVTGAVVRDVY